MKQPTYWCVFNHAGHPVPDTTRYYRSDAISAALEFWDDNVDWRRCKRAYGWSVRRVRIVEVEKE